MTCSVSPSMAILLLLGPYTKNFLFTIFQNSIILLFGPYTKNYRYLLRYHLQKNITWVRYLNLSTYSYLINKKNTRNILDTKYIIWIFTEIQKNIIMIIMNRKVNFLFLLRTGPWRNCLMCIITLSTWVYLLLGKWVTVYLNSRRR